MANTINDIPLPYGTWVNAYSATGISVGTALVVQNKSSQAILMKITPSQPASNDTNGILLLPSNPMANVPSGASGCWLASIVPWNGTANVQTAS